MTLIKGMGLEIDYPPQNIHNVHNWILSWGAGHIITFIKGMGLGMD